MYDYNVLNEQLAEAMLFMKQKLEGRAPRVGIILGSGLNPLAESIENAVYVPFADVPHMKKSTAEGHVGRFVCGIFGGKEVLAMQGRLHGYEGNTAVEVAFPVWLMHRLGVEVLITTNAAGAINETFSPGEFCIMSDHINFTGRNPIANAEAAEISERFFSMTDAYDPALRKLAIEAARDAGVTAHEGVYLGLLGPSFETPAEIRMFRAWGADTVAMSVVEEVIAARHAGMRVLGMSLVSNMAAGVGATAESSGAAPTGDEVMVLAKTREAAFLRFMREIVERID